MHEPSILDYLKAKLTPWRGPAPAIPPSQTDAPTDVETPLQMQPQAVTQAADTAVAPAVATHPLAVARAAAFPWRSSLALLLALLAQMTLEPQPDHRWTTGAGLYIVAFAFLVWAYVAKEWVSPSVEVAAVRQETFTFRRGALWDGMLLAVLAFWQLGGNRFTWINLLLWIGSIAFFLRAFWQPSVQASSWFVRLRSFLAHPQWTLVITRWVLLFAAVGGLVLFFRLYRLNQVPPEMVSDQAEKLWDVYDLLHGQTKIFFERNTGREGLQMYLTAAVLTLFGTGYSFLSLKIGTTIAALVTLPYVYLLGKEVGGRRVGLIAMAFTGVAYWSNVITRVGLRFTLSPLFVAPVLYYLIRGLRRSNRNDFILAGLALGLGLHGYSPIRVLPFVVLAAVGFYLLHWASQGRRLKAVWGLALLVLMAVAVFLPLLRYWYDEPQMFNYRTLTRLGTVEQPLPGPAWQIFLSNLGKASVMFAWDNGEVWPVSVTHRPALDVVSAALFYLGVVLLLVRYLMKRDWLDITWLVSIPILLLPSVLSLAFPAENPILNRTAGAIIPTFIIVALALDGLMSALEASLQAPWGSRLAWGLCVLLFAWSARQNYDLVFNQYQHSYELSAWNTTELGRVVRDFIETIGSQETAWVVGYPHWVDTRLVGINAGYPIWDTYIAPEKIPDTLAEPRAKLFLVKPDDVATIEILRQVYPQASVKEFISRVETKNFLIFFIPPQGSVGEAGAAHDLSQATPVNLAYGISR